MILSNLNLYHSHHRHHFHHHRHCCRHCCARQWSFHFISLKLEILCRVQLKAPTHPPVWPPGWMGEAWCVAAGVSTGGRCLLGTLTHIGHAGSQGSIRSLSQGWRPPEPHPYATIRTHRASWHHTTLPPMPSQVKGWWTEIALATPDLPGTD